MTSREFAYWLQGYFEVNDSVKPLTLAQTETIKRHLALVFKHEIDPSYPNQKELNAIHKLSKQAPPIDYPNDAGEGLDTIVRC